MPANKAIPAIINPQLHRQNLAECIANAGSGDLWIFGYGSLMWKPGFRPLATEAARLYGYSRQLAVRSRHYRGTRQQPGLVFGLDRGGSCNGVLLRAAKKNKKQIIARLFLREMFAQVYKYAFIQVRLLSSGKTVRALTFVTCRDNILYAPRMPVRRAAKIICAAKGHGGRNADYITGSHRELSRHGIPCPQLARLTRMVEQMDNNQRKNIGRRK